MGGYRREGGGESGSLGHVFVIICIGSRFMTNEKFNIKIWLLSDYFQFSISESCRSSGYSEMRWYEERVNLNHVILLKCE